MAATGRSSARPLRKATLSSRLGDAIGGQILTGALAPGAKINLDRLRAAHHTSVSPLREAMTRLVATGLVEFEDQRGYRVAGVSAQNLAEITALRQEMETLALRQAMMRGTLDWESAVIGALHRLERAAPQAAVAPPDAYQRFHLTLIDGAATPLLAGFCAMLLTLDARYRLLFPPAPGSPPDDAGEHRAIAEAAVAREQPRAEALLRAHIARGGARLLAAMTAADARPQHAMTGALP